MTRPFSPRRHPVHFGAGTGLAERLALRSVLAGDCRIWEGTVTHWGYGVLSWEGKLVYVHRAAWELENGPIPDGMFICHRCDTPLCIRPEHLFAGTHEDNMADAKAKGRMHLGVRNGRALWAGR